MAGVEEGDGLDARIETKLTPTTQHHDLGGVFEELDDVVG